MMRRPSRRVRGASRLQDQFLHPPVQEFGDIQHVLRRAGHRVNTAKLLELLSGLAEHAEHLALETQLIDAAGPGVGTVKHLVRRWRDAERPWRARRKRAAGHHRLIRYPAARR